MKSTRNEPIEESVAGSVDRHTPLGLTDADVSHMYRTMLLARAFDERASILFAQGKIPFTVTGHGHEAARWARPGA